jgi:hypothetical protein
MPSRWLRTDSSLLLLASEHFNELCLASSSSTYEYKGCFPDQIRPYFLFLSISLLSARGYTRHHGTEYFMTNTLIVSRLLEKFTEVLEKKKFPSIIKRPDQQSVTWSIWIRSSFCHSFSLIPIYMYVNVIWTLCDDHYRAQSKEQAHINNTISIQ